MLIVGDLVVIKNIFLSLIWIYGLVFLYCLTVFNFATVNLSDFFHSMLISVIIISLFRLLRSCQGQVVRVFAAVVVLFLLIGICGFGLGGLPHFPLTGVVSNVFDLCV